MLASQLKKRGLDITIYHYSENALPDGSCDYIVKDSIDMLKKANFDGMDILIHQVGKTTEWYQTLEKTSIKSVAWSHVYLDYDELKDVRKCNNVKRVVFVGKEEYDSYIDDDVIKKSTYIFNMIPKMCIRDSQKADSPLLYERVAKKDKAAKAGMIHGDAKLQSLFHNRERCV